jgi:hypothetical protein
MRIPRIASYSFILYVYYIIFCTHNVYDYTIFIQFRKCRTFCYVENNSYSSIFSFLLPPCFYFFFFVTCFQFLFFPHLATSLSLFLASSSSIFFRYFVLHSLFFFLHFPFSFFLSSSFTFRYLCISLLSLFYLLSSFHFVSSLRILLVFCFLPRTCALPSAAHTHTQYLEPMLISVTVFPILTKLFAE